MSDVTATDIALMREDPTAGVRSDSRPLARTHDTEKDAPTAVYRRNWLKDASGAEKPSFVQELNCRLRQRAEQAASATGAAIGKGKLGRAPTLKNKRLALQRVVPA